MPEYEWTHSDPFHDNRNDRVVEQGEIVELPERVAEPHPEFNRVERREVEDTAVAEDEPETYTCAGNDGECSREVDEKGAYCWQHAPDE